VRSVLPSEPSAYIPTPLTAVGRLNEVPLSHVCPYDSNPSGRLVIRAALVHIRGRHTYVVDGRGHSDARDSCKEVRHDDRRAEVVTGERAPRVLAIILLSPEAS